MRKRKVIRGALAAAGILAAAFLLLYPRLKQEHDNAEIEEMADITEADPFADPKSFMKSIDFDALQRVNPDIIGWIVVEGTDISYPILQSSASEPEDYYLSHDFRGRAAFHGAIYIQKRNTPDFSDFMTIAYGHNMRDGSMFRQLHHFRDASFLKKNHRVAVFTPEGFKQYEIQSAEIVRNENILDVYDDFRDEDVREAYLKTISQESEIGHLLVLSTCCGDSARRMIVTCKEMKRNT